MDSRKSTTYGQCRCCLAKGYHKDLMRDYFNNGIREVYYDIFMECFNLFLSTDANMTKLICTACVDRLREASSFRMMVVGTERQLLESLNGPDDKQMVFVNVPIAEAETCSIVVKKEDDVKEEESDVEPDDTDCDPDYIPNEEQSPLPTPAVGGVDVKCLVAGEAALRARGQAARLPSRHALRRLCPEYHAHLKLLAGMIITPYTIAKMLDEERTRPKLNRSKVIVTEKMAHIVNACALLEHSTAIPFRSKSRLGFPCFYCRRLCSDAVSLHEHTRLHNKAELKKVLSTAGAECFVVYADVTDLACNICHRHIPNLNQLKAHLTKDHHKTMYLDHNDRVIPYKLSTDDVFECQMCGFKFETFGSIERHMNVHFRNYVCKECGTGFVTKYRLKVHIKSMHVGGSFPCEVCGKVFTSQQKHKNHVDTVHKLVKRFKCTKCPERFSEYFKRQKHMVEVHGVAKLQYNCNVCEKSFDRRYTLSRHLKRDHLEERDFQCELCSYKCFTNNELRVHMIKHNGERIYECSVCKKSYARKKTLKEHMRIHNNDRRFACAVCGQAFVQKCSLKGHLKTHHHTYNLPGFSAC